MQEHIVIEYSYSWLKASIQNARRFTEEEKPHYADWFREKGFVGLGDHLLLEEIRMEDMPKRQADGAFLECNNAAWIITPEERDTYIALNEKRAKEQAEAKRLERIEDLRERIKHMERQHDLPSKEEAKRRMKSYNNVINEGGEGFVPYIYSREEYEFAKAELKALAGNVNT